jgi:AcrR family transcriptional regulator
MRTVAEQANVALGTLYRYFPSRIHLLVSALVREFERTQQTSSWRGWSSRRARPAMPEP